MKRLTPAVSPQNLAPLVTMRRVEHWLGKVNIFPHVDRLVRALVPGVPVDMAQGGINFIEDLKYGNYTGFTDHAEVKARTK